MSVAGLADCLGCSRDLIYRAAKSGDLRVVRLGGKLIRITAEDAAKWLRAMTPEVKPKPKPVINPHENLRAIAYLSRKAYENK